MNFLQTDALMFFSFGGGGGGLLRFLLTCTCKSFQDFRDNEYIRVL